MNKNNKLKSNIEEYNTTIAKSFHKLDYYIAEGYRILNTYAIEKEKSVVHTDNKDKTTEIINKYVKLIDTVQQKELRILNAIYQTNKNAAINNLEPPIHKDIMSIISNPIILISAYRNIRKNKGALTKAFIPEFQIKTLPIKEQEILIKKSKLPDGINFETFITISNILKTDKFIWDINKRTWIPKPGKKNTKRPITIPSFADKIIQEAIKMVLEAIYEPWFEKMNCSFAFRANYGCHDAIVSIKQTQAMKTAIEGDFKGAYDKVDHNKMISCLSKRITDRKFLNFMRTRLKIIIYDKINKQNPYETQSIGIPQGGIDSPFLYNIYMYEFDSYIQENFQHIFDQENKKRLISKQTKKPLLNNPVNPLYNKINQKIKRTKKIKEQILEKIKSNNLETKHNNLMELYDTLKTLKKEKIIQRKTPSLDPHRVKLRYKYVRYADDFIILTNASIKFCNHLKETMTQWLTENLHAELSPEKTEITDIRKKPAKFIGFEIKSKTTRLIKDVKLKKLNKTITRRVAGWRTNTYPDKQRLISRLHMKGYCDKHGFSREIPWISGLDFFEIIDRFNSVLLGLGNYYSEFIDNNASLSRWIYIIRSSCLKTLAQKYKTTTTKLLKEFTHLEKFTMILELEIKGKLLQKDYSLIRETDIHERNKKLRRFFKIRDRLNKIEKYGFFDKNNIKFQTPYNRTPRPTDPNYLDRLNKINWRTQASFDLPCTICGSTEKVEMHHIKAVRTYKYNFKSKKFQKILYLRNRKQIPVCQKCHNEIHSNTNYGKKLSNLYDNRIVNQENYIRTTPYESDLPKDLIQRMITKGWRLKNS